MRALFALAAAVLVGYACTTTSESSEGGDAGGPDATAETPDSGGDSAGDSTADAPETGSASACTSIERISVTSLGAQLNEQSKTPAISADGRYVAFTSFAPNLVPNDFNGTWDVFVFDRDTRQLERVSVSSSGVEGNGPSGEYSADESLAISDDGRYVAFGSTADNLVADDGNGSPDVFVHDRMTKQTIRASLADDGSEVASGPGNGARALTLSGNGGRVSFVSVGGAFVKNDTNPYNVFVRDIVNGLTLRASEQGNIGALSGDGHLVAFNSKKTDFDAGDGGVGPRSADGGFGLYTFDIDAGAMETLINPSGGFSGFENLAVSDDGRYVAFATALSLTASDTNGIADVYRFDRMTRTVARVSPDGTSATTIGISGAGDRIAFTSGMHVVYLRDFADDTLAVVSRGLNDAGVGAQAPSLSRDGRCIAFASAANNLVTDDTNGKTDVFVGPAR